jgi:APA family basic amino acid/polyamine antiporter
MMLRHKSPEALRPYRMFGYPFTAVLFLAVSGGIVISACISAPAPSAAGIFIVASGVPAYYLWRHRH